MEPIDNEHAGTSRRAFLGLGMGAAALAMTSPVAATAEAAKRKRPYRESKRVDVHAHHLAPAYLDALHNSGVNSIGGIPIPEWSPELALGFMDAHGIAVQMLSVSDPGVSFVSAADAPGLAQACNDYVAGVVRAHSKRFGAFAVLPLQDVDAARAEVTRSLDTLKLDGIGLLSSSEGRYLGDPAFEPLLAEFDKREAWVFVHPTVADDDRPSYGIPNFIAEYPFDTTRTIISLIFNGVFTRHPNIRWHFAHAGGTIPMLRLRLTALAGAAKAFGPALGLPSGSSILTAKSPERALRKSFFDTALVADEPSLAAAKETAGAGQIVFGSDWPFASILYGPKGDPQPTLSRVFSADKRHAIDRLNARREFKRLAKIVPGA